MKMQLAGLYTTKNQIKQAAQNRKMVKWSYKCVFKLNFGDRQKCLDNIRINGFSCSPILADFTGKNCMSAYQYLHYCL